MALAGTLDLRTAYAELCEVRPAYATAEAYYDGDVDELYASDKVAKLLAKSNLDEFEKFNFARIPVDAVVNKLRITAVTAAAGPGGTEGAEEDVAELFRRNQLRQELPGLHRRACSLGDAYLMVWPETGDDGAVLGVNMYCNSPATVRAIYDDEHPLRIKLVIKSWCEGSGKNQIIRADLYYGDHVERWAWQGKHSGKQDKWEHYEDDGQPWTMPYPWDFDGMPWFHYRTDRPYGRPEHYAAYGPQSAINKIVLAHLATVDYQSLPQRYGLIDPQVDQSGQQSDFDPDNPEDEEGDPESPLNPSQLRNDPGEFWMLQGLKGVGQFEAANPDVYLKPFDRYIKAMATLTYTPFHAFDSTGVAISGESRREANGQLNDKVADRQESFGATHTDAFAFALKLLGWDEPTVTVQWKPVEQVTDAEGWATVSAKIAAGVPREQALVEAGCDREQVKAWLAALDDDAELTRRAELLERIGNAVQALGTGVQLQAITSDQVTTLLDGILGAAATLGEETET